jgi:hypothetical protein
VATIFAGAKTLVRRAHAEAVRALVFTGARNSTGVCLAGSGRRTSSRIYLSTHISTLECMILNILPFTHIVPVEHP